MEKLDKGGGSYELVQAGKVSSSILRSVLFLICFLFLFVYK